MNEVSLSLRDPMPDETPSVASACRKDILWYKWTVLSLTGTSILFWLNFSEYCIGAEIGTSPQQTANILGALQLAVKIHELTIVASIFNIIQQWVLGELLSGGTLLGLLGAESAMSAPSFIISEGFLVAVRYGIRGIFNPQQKSSSPGIKVLRLALFTLCGCVLSGLAGPASGVLMIPRVGWFESSRVFRSDQNLLSWPNIMIGTDQHRIEQNVDAPYMNQKETNPFSLPPLFVAGGLNYWPDLMVQLSQSITNRDHIRPNSFHTFQDHYGSMFMNITATLNRTLDGEWQGETVFRTAMKDRFLNAKVVGDISISENLKVTVRTQALAAQTTCRSRDKIPCSEGAILSSNPSDLDWCYLSVDKNNTSGTLRTSRNLLMASDFKITNKSPVVWITEGPRIAKNSYFSESIEIIIDTHRDGRYNSRRNPYRRELVVCSFSGAIIPATASSFGTFFRAKTIEDSNDSIMPNGAIAESRKILFHENWLDRAYAYNSELWHRNLSMTYPDQFTYPPRPRGVQPPGNLLAEFGSSIGLSVIIEQVHTIAVATPFDAYALETIIGGSLAYLLSWTPVADSQYSMPYDQIPPQFTQGLTLPWSEAVELGGKVYQQGYGFRLSSRTGYLGVTVLVLHAVLVIAGSLRQLIYSRSIINAWNGVPDYTMLGAGSPNLHVAYRTINAGKEALRGHIAMRARSEPLATSASTANEPSRPWEENTPHFEPGVVRARPLMSMSFKPPFLPNDHYEIVVMSPPSTATLTRSTDMRRRVARDGSTTS